MAEIKKYLDNTALEALVGQIKAEDAKVLQGAKDYADGLAKNYDAAGAAATAEANAKAYTDELANGQVKTNKEDIAKLNGDVNTDGSVAKAIATAKAGIDADIDAVEAKADKNAEDIAAINNGTTGILAQAKQYTNDEVAKVQGDVNELETYVGTFTASEGVDTVVKYIDAKTANIASDATVNALADRVTQAEKDIDAIEADYLKAADKTELAEDIADVQTALTQEIERADAAEKANAAAIKAISDDYLKTADKTALQDQITANANAIEVLTEGIDAEKVDGVKDLIDYVEKHGPEVTGMKEDIADNAEAIEGVAGRVDTLESEMDAVEGAVATKAEKTYVDEKVEALTGEDTAIKGRLDVIEGKLGTGEGSVASAIDAAKQAAIEAAAGDATQKANKALEDAKKYADDEDAKIEARVSDLETASATHALASDLTALDGRVGVNEKAISGLVTDLDAAEERIGVNEGAISTINTELAKKAAKTDLDNAVARIAVNEGDIAGLKSSVATKAEQEDLNGAIARISQNETDIAANTSAINSFVAITADEVNALFA